MHLAVINNDSHQSLNEFREVNVHFLTRVIEVAQKLEIRTFINLTTTHATTSKKLSNYALTKIEGKSAGKGEGD